MSVYTITGASVEAITFFHANYSTTSATHSTLFGRVIYVHINRYCNTDYISTCKIIICAHVLRAPFYGRLISPVNGYTVVASCTRMQTAIEQEIHCSLLVSIT